MILQVQVGFVCERGKIKLGTEGHAGRIEILDFGDGDGNGDGNRDGDG